MKLWLSLVIHIPLLVTNQPSATSQGVTKTGKESRLLSGLDRLMSSFMEKHHVTGAAMAVGYRERLVYARGFGFADRDSMKPVEPDSLFRIASVTKPITATAVLQLADRKKLKLNDRVFSILEITPLPGSKPDPRLSEITIDELLHHTGGWDRDRSGDPMFKSIEIARTLGAKPPARIDQIIRYMAGQRLDFKPGDKYAYSNFGYCLLGRVIEKVSGQSYEEYVKKNVLAPLGIRRMELGRTLPQFRANGEVRYYSDGTGGSVFSPDIGQPVPQPYGVWCLESMDSHGGWIASAIDLVRFGEAFNNPAHCKILSAKSIKDMFALPKTTIGKESGPKQNEQLYGCGWQMRQIGNAGKLNTWHGGYLAGSSTLLVRRWDGITYAILFNNSNSSTTNEALIDALDPQIHPILNEIKTWPTVNMYDKYLRPSIPDA